METALVLYTNIWRKSRTVSLEVQSNGISPNFWWTKMDSRSIDLLQLPIRWTLWSKSRNCFKFMCFCFEWFFSHCWMITHFILIFIPILFHSEGLNAFHRWNVHLHIYLLILYLARQPSISDLQSQIWNVHFSFRLEFCFLSFSLPFKGLRMFDVEHFKHERILHLECKTTRQITSRIFQVEIYVYFITIMSSANKLKKKLTYYIFLSSSSNHSV